MENPSDLKNLSDQANFLSSQLKNETDYQKCKSCEQVTILIFKENKREK